MRPGNAVATLALLVAISVSPAAGASAGEGGKVERFVVHGTTGCWIVAGTVTVAPAGCGASDFFRFAAFGTSERLTGVQLSLQWVPNLILGAREMSLVFLAPESENPGIESSGTVFGGSQLVWAQGPSVLTVRVQDTPDDPLYGSGGKEAGGNFTVQVRPPIHGVAGSTSDPTNNVQVVVDQPFLLCATFAYGGARLPAEDACISA